MTDLLNYAQDLSEAGQYDEAYRIADKQLKNDPDSPQWLQVMGYLMLETDKPSLAYQISKRVIDILPKDAGGWLNLGMACRDMRRDQEALRYFKRGLKLSRNDKQQSMLCVNISSALVDMGRFKEGEKYCHKALEYNPESPKAIMNLGFCQLGQRNWADGWKNYRAVIGHEWRPRFQYNDEPLWDGKGKGTIVLYGEQGLGDQISFASMLPDVLEWADKNDSRIIVDTVPRLVSLFERSFPNLRVYGTLGENSPVWASEDRTIDYSLPIGQVGEYFRTKDSDFPGTPYLKADPDRVLQWKALFESKNKPVIGIAWSSGIFKTGSTTRRVSLEALLPIFESVDAHWVSLQYKPASRDIANFKKQHPEIDLVEYPYGTLSGDYDDTVAMIAAMDHVVAMHTTANHVSGGLGIPTSVLVPKNSQWRYGSGCKDFVWADSLTLFQQTKNGKWDDVVEDVAGDLNARFAGIRETAAGAA